MRIQLLGMNSWLIDQMTRKLYFWVLMNTQKKFNTYDDFFGEGAYEDFENALNEFPEQYENI